MGKKKQIEQVSIIENIFTQPMEDIMGSRYATYAKYVIQDRAIPDSRDGLKPVQRRIIYSMWKQGNLCSRPTRKCARIVGDVIGKYHPHGDTSIYDSLVRMSQTWKNNVVLIDFQGNNGSIDGDSAAAYRYTESRLSQIAEEMTRDIEKNTVDMTLTFDDTELEPNVLPSRFPNLLVNGAKGIAVALATEIPPHNLKEVIAATIYRINNQDSNLNQLMKYIKGPDFPTGGIIYNTPSLFDIYETGRGRVEIVSKTEIIQGDKINQIVINEIPFETVKISLVYELDKLRLDKLLNGIIEVRDESDRFGMRIVIDVKKEADIETIHRYLITKTGLRSSYSANMVAIVNNRPKTMSLCDFLDSFIQHQVEVVTRRCNFDLKKLNNRLHIVNGLIKAISILNDVVDVIRSSKDKNDAKINLQDKFEFTETQSEAIVMLQLYKLTNTDVTVLENEKVTIEENIEFLNKVLSDRNILNNLLITDLKAISKKYGSERKTQIVDKDVSYKAIDKKSMILKENVYLSITRDGYIKRSSMRSYQSSGANSLPGLKQDDVLIYNGLCETTDIVIAFTNLGNYLYIPVFEIESNKWKDEGKHLNSIVSLNEKEKIIKAFTIENFKEGIYFVIASKYGQIKRVELPNFVVTRYSKPIKCMKLLDSDTLSDVSISTGNDNIYLFTNNGNSTGYNENQIPVSSLSSGGVKGISSLSDSFVNNILCVKSDINKYKIIAITDKGCYRIYDISNTIIGKRPGKQYSFFKSFKNDIHKLVGIRQISNKDIASNFHALNSKNEVISFDIDDYYVTPLDKYAKKNIDLSVNMIKTIKYLFLEEDYRISSSIIPTKPLLTNNTIMENNADICEIEETKKETIDTGLTQISLFDDLDDDN